MCKSKENPQNKKEMTKKISFGAFIYIQANNTTTTFQITDLQKG